ncbi:YdcF family protein [bacterium]|nr:YdcF family protein [bacterium]
MASPSPELNPGLSSWPLLWVRFLKDFVLDLGCVATLGFFVQWFLPGLSKKQRILCLSPIALLVLSSVRGMPEFWASPLLAQSNMISQEDCKQPPRALVVLGGGLAGPNDLAVSTLSRVRHAAQWMNVLKPEQRQSIKIVLSGGPSLSGSGTPESVLMKEAFHAWRPDLSDENVIPEIFSLNTHDNALRVADILGDGFRESGTIALVTSGLHMLRAARVFQTVGLRVCPVPSPSIDHASEGFLNFRNGERTVRVLNEYAGLAGYRLAGWIK